MALWTPRRSRIGSVAGSRDSPTWKRGNGSRSTRSTRRPARARKALVVEPGGPPAGGGGRLGPADPARPPAGAPRARPAPHAAARGVRADRRPVAERTKSTAPPRPRDRLHRHFAHLPATPRRGDEHLRLQHEAAVPQLDLVEQRDGIGPVPGLRVLELEPARPVDEESGDTDRVH